MSDQNNLEAMRHSLSHIMAAAVWEIYGTTTQFGVGPAVENGFYYDVLLAPNGAMGSLGVTISEEDLPKIEKKMRGIIARKLPIVASEKSRKDALRWAEESGQRFKRELIEELPSKGATGSLGEKITFYSIGEFEDLCRGPHVANTGEVGAFRLSKVAGAYWRGDEKREQMQRVYGVAFATEEELAAYLKQQEEARERDHRKLGRELDLFCFSELVGSGLPMFTPRGTVLREKLNEFAQGYRLRAGYQKVWASHIANVELYRKSGHYEKFPELLKFTSSESGDELALKPVGCPHHIQIYASVPRSYKDLPIKYLDTSTMYRDEKKGELGGLSRVRALTQDDSHVFCTEAQVEGVFGELIEAAKDMYRIFDMKLRLRLSFRDDGDGYIGETELWEKAQKSIQAMAEKFGMEYTIGVGEAAMYGPKMDFMAVDALGREWQLATVQLDYALPGRFGLEYTDADGKKKVPTMVHCALIGSIERFLSVYIEHTAGWFPMWCAPEQVRVVMVNDEPAVVEYAAKVAEVLGGVELEEPIRHNELRYTVDRRGESLRKKIREASGMRVPVVLVVGARDAEGGVVSARLRDREEKVGLAGLAEWLRGV